MISYSYEDDLIVECFKIFNAVKKIGRHPVSRAWPKFSKPVLTPMDASTAYDVLHLQSSAPPELIKAAYRVMSKLYHPDVCSRPDANDQMKRINAAYEELREVEKL